MFTYPKLDLTIVRELNTRLLRWPAGDEVCDDAAPGGNRMYADMRRLSWSEAERVFRLEGELMQRIERAHNPESELDAVEDELCESDGNLYGLDLGVASTVVALSAARCIPFTSCNAGVFGGGHLEAYPLVGFFVRPQLVSEIMAAAVQANIGLENHDDGTVLAYAADVRRLRDFASGLVERRQLLNAVGVRTKRRRSRPTIRQLSLWEESDSPSR